MTVYKIIQGFSDFLRPRPNRWYFKTTRPSSTGVHNSNLKRAKKIKGPKSICFDQYWGCCFQQTSFIYKILGFAGQIKSFRGPHLARGPYVVHACSRVLWVGSSGDANYYNSLIFIPIWPSSGAAKYLHNLVRVAKTGKHWSKNSVSQF